MTLIDHPDRPLSRRDIGAWIAILERLRRAEAEARATRLRIAHELGFDARHPSEVKAGDTIRVNDAWYEVVSRTKVNPETGMPSYWHFYFGEGEGYYDVDDWSDDAPISPVSVIVAVPEPDLELF